MKLRNLKRLGCKVASVFCVLFIVCLFCSAVEGTLHWPVALVLCFVDLIVLNALCGALLPMADAPVGESSVRTVTPALQVIKGGSAA